MKRYMMQKMMPMMQGFMNKMDFQAKEDMMARMMPQMMEGFTREEKLKMMMKFMPVMMDDMEMEDMEAMMQQMMPQMKERCKSSGIDMLKMMETMCPKCISIAILDADQAERERLKAAILDAFEKEGDL